MRQLWAWMLVPLASGWSTFPANDFFFHRPRQEVQPFHFLPDSYQLASQKVQETVSSKGATKSKVENEDKHREVTHGEELKSGKSKVDKDESSRKGHSEKEKVSKKYGEQAGKKQKTSSKNENQGNDHSSHEGGKEDFFKDKLLYKSGNYEKGYRNKYHLDEELKHNKYWKDHHTMDKFHKYDKHGSQFHKKSIKKNKKSDKKESQTKKKEGKKGETAGESSSSEHKGHQSKTGKESHYEHKKDYHKKIPEYHMN